MKTKKTDTYNYYEEQLSKINFKSDYHPKLKITDADGNETKWMDLNPESISVLIKFLQSKESIKSIPKDESIDFHRINNDSNGNPRYVVHFLDLLTEGEKNNTVANLSLEGKYKIALLRAKKLGGRKYDNKSYGGGIVFQSYNNTDLEKKIKELTKSNSVSGTKTSTDSLIVDIAKRGTITEKEMKLLLLRKNKGEKFDDAPIWDGEIELSKDQSQKGLKWLRNLWKSPTGKERSTNPFGSREEAIIDDSKATMYLKGFHDAGNASHSFWVPLYEVAGDNTTMEYYVSGGKVNIVG